MHRVRTTILIVGILTVAMALTPAQAATNSKTATATTTGSGLGAASAITCNYQIDDIHDSHHIDGTINDESHITCDAPMASLSMVMRLVRNNIVVKSKGSGNQGLAVLNGKVNTACQRGTWYGETSVQLQFPPGYTPQFIYDTIRSQNTLNVTSCA
jgi:hypothetical protein